MVAVRLATQDDVAIAAQIHGAARRSYYRAGGYEPDQSKEPGVAGWAPYFDDLRTQIAFGELADETARVVVGFACAQERDDDQAPYLELVALYVDPDSWSHGVGSALHEWYTGKLSQSPHAHHGTLEVWAGNERARTFYKTRGWQETGHDRPGPLDLPFLTLRLRRSAG